MTAGSTYVAISTSTLGTAQSSVTFSSISGSYTDLILVCSYSLSTGANLRIQVGNGSVDTGSNYSRTYLAGTSGPGTGKTNSETSWDAAYSASNTMSNAIMNFQNYSNTIGYKNILIRNNDPSDQTALRLGLWPNTSAINTITLFPSSSANFNSGSMFTLYGIAAA